MALVRTPAERFEDLPGYDYEAEYVSVGDPEMAYVDVATRTPTRRSSVSTANPPGATSTGR